MEPIYDSKNNNCNGHNDSEDGNSSNHFIDEISFPFVPCHFTKHKKFGPQTVISHFTFDAQKNSYHLFCNTCLKDIEKKDHMIYPGDIEEFVEKFLQKLSTRPLECPLPSPLLLQAYELKQQHVVSFKKRIEKEVQVITQTYEDIIQEVTKMILEKRDYVIKSFNSISDIFTQSYDLFNLKYERLFKSNDKLSHLKEMNELRVKDELQEIKTAEEYEDLLKNLKELDDLCQELTNREKRTDELVHFSDTLQTLYHLLPPVPTNRKGMVELCIAKAQEAVGPMLSQSAFKKNQIIQKVSLFCCCLIIMNI